MYEEVGHKTRKQKTPLDDVVEKHNFWFWKSDPDVLLGL